MIEADDIAAGVKEETIAVQRGVSFFDLEPGMCKFPLGALHDPPLRFCGEPAPVGSPYCPRCRAIAYVPSRRI
jgi:hypothetical protein